MGIKAKFYLQEITETQSGFKVKLSAVTDGKGGNAEWSKWTPSGELTMLITNEDALPFFRGLFEESNASKVRYDAARALGAPSEELAAIYVKPEVYLTLEAAT